MACPYIGAVADTRMVGARMMAGAIYRHEPYGSSCILMSEVTWHSDSDPHFFCYFLIDNDNMDNFREFNCCKIIFTIPD